MCKCCSFSVVIFASAQPRCPSLYRPDGRPGLVDVGPLRGLNCTRLLDEATYRLRFNLQVQIASLGKNTSAIARHLWMTWKARSKVVLSRHSCGHPTFFAELGKGPGFLHSPTLFDHRRKRSISSGETACMLYTQPAHDNLEALMSFCPTHGICFTRRNGLLTLDCGTFSLTRHTFEGPLQEALPRSRR